MKTSAHAHIAALAAGLLLTSSAAVSAQESGTYTVTQGGTAIATESFTRSGELLETQLEVTGQGILATVSALGENATVDRMELRVLPAGDPDGEPLQSVAAAFGEGTVTVEQPIGSEIGSEEAPDGLVPYINPSPSYMEQVLRRARAIGGDDVTVQVWAMGPQGGQTIPATVTFENDAATLSFGGVDIQVTTDADGRLLSAEVPSQGLTITRE